MKHISLTPFGRQPVTAGLLQARSHAPAPHETAVDCVEKWAVFDDLRTAKAQFHLSDRDLAVLHALLSFLPGKVLNAADSLIVFPSNHSLSARAHGMAHSTLRRHLAALVGAGLIWRQDSANGKRFAARDHRGLMVTAFGFDLRPLLLRAVEIGTLADQHREAEAALQLARQHVVLGLRDCAKLISFGRLSNHITDWQSFDLRLTPVRAALRRKLSLAVISQMQAVIDELLVDISAELTPKTDITSGSAAQNDCHHTESNKEPFVLEPPFTADLPTSTGKPETVTHADIKDTETTEASQNPLPFDLILQACPDMQYYSPSPILNWRDLVMMAGHLHTMMGIPSSIWIEAQRVMGPINAAITVAAMLQRMALIQNPSGYLRKLSLKATSGSYSPTGMIMSLLRPQMPVLQAAAVSADGLGVSQS